MSKKIIRIIARLNIGGPARNAVILTKGLEAKGFSTILLCGEVAKGEGDMRYIAREYGVRPILIKGFSRELSFNKDWKALWAIFSLIWREKPAIVHTHTAKAGTLGRIAAILYNIFQCILFRKERCKIAHTFHGHVFHSYFSKKKTAIFIQIEKILALFTDKIVTVSEILKEELVYKFNITRPEKVSVVELGFDLESLLDLPKKEEASEIVIGTVGRLVHVKNQQMLFKVASRLKTSDLKKKIKFVIVGEGELGDELENLVEKLGISGMVEFRGWIENLPNIYRDFDIVALTSLNEGTPVSIIEGMAAARPVVATKVGGVSDLVEDGKNGYLVYPDSIPEFTERIVDLINDPEKRARFGEHGRKAVKERFSKDRLINDMEKLYNGILKIAEEKK